MENQWAAFAKLHLKVCSNPEKPPFQWIYAVDDAWFHPEGIDFKKIESEFKRKQNDTTGKSVPFNPAIFGSIQANHVASGVILNELKPDNVQNTTEQTDDESEVDSEADAVDTKPDAEKMNDREVAVRLIEFIEEEDRKGTYGICFCSFEYFWDNYADINESQNAVFFDINHAFRGLDSFGELNQKWEEELKQLGLFNDDICATTTLHGWLLHYAVKLGQLEDNGKTNIIADHILIISSAIAGDTSLQQTKDAFSQYSTVQLSIWQNLDKLRNDFRMTDFGFSPLPKIVHTLHDNGTLLDSGLGIFDKTFALQGNWKQQRKAMLQDLLEVWRNHDWGHFDKQPKSRTDLTLRYDSWIEDGDDYKRDIRGCCLFIDNRDQDKEIRINSLKAILQAAAKRIGVDVEDNCNGHLQTHVNLPMRPGVTFIIALIDLLESLANTENKNGRTKPELIFAANDKFHIVLRLGCKDGSTELKAKYESHSSSDNIPTGFNTSTACIRRFKHENLIKQHLQEEGLECKQDTWNDKLNGNYTPEIKPEICFEGYQITFKLNFYTDKGA